MSIKAEVERLQADKAAAMAEADAESRARIQKIAELAEKLRSHLDLQSADLQKLEIEAEREGASFNFRFRSKKVRVDAGPDSYFVYQLVPSRSASGIRAENTSNQQEIYNLSEIDTYIAEAFFGDIGNISQYMVAGCVAFGKARQTT